MAQSRLEKVGTIYSRITSLIKAKAIPEENKPLWLDIYKAFPPKYEPTFGRPASGPPIRNIFYQEDKIRARFHKDHRRYSNINLSDNNSVSKTEAFILIYRQLEKDGVVENEIYDKAVEEFLAKYKREQVFKEADAASESVPRQRKTMSIKKLVADGESKYAEKLAKEGNLESLGLTEEERKQFKPIRLSLEKLFETDKDEEGKYAEKLAKEGSQESVGLTEEDKNQLEPTSSHKLLEINKNNEISQDTKKSK